MKPQKNNTKAWEYNFDGLIGPTHNYAGLSIGNVASMTNKYKISNPKKAALEGLEKMKFLMDKGFKQAVLPPQERPHLKFLKQLGFTGTPKKILNSAKQFSPQLLASCYASSNMWVANSAVISPSADTKNNKVHFTPANLQSFLHRSLETTQTSLVLKKIFFNSQYFVHHKALPCLPAFSDEGAANHNRLCSTYSSPGVELFIYGRKGFDTITKTKKFKARQTKEASQIIALRHKLNPKKTIIALQNSQAIDSGVFHNDVICVSDKNLIFHHELAFQNTTDVLKQIEQKLYPTPLLKITVLNKQISLKDCISSYLFNSQLLSIGINKWMLLAPQECNAVPSVKKYLKFLVKNSVIKKIHFISIKQSMQNGGGPACLRLKVVLTKQEAQSIHQGVCLNQKLYLQLKQCINKYYQDTLNTKDLLNPLLIQESHGALNEISNILNLQNIYSFQK